MPRFTTPILFLIFNRPAETKRVFATLRDLRPTRLFVAGDGPRAGRAQEAELVAETRKIATEIDWPCELVTLFREQNLGCGPAVSGAITWFFQQVESGIILEDDCLPHPDFFPYCATLLERYRDEPRIATIAGTHFLPPSLPHTQTHYVSKYFQMWGWASWRRTWQHYDFDLSALTEQGFDALLQATHPVALERAYWTQIFRTLKAGAIDTWDFQVFFAAWRMGAHHVMPGRNLIANIGYGPSATHTNFASVMAELPTQPLQLDDVPVPLIPDPIIDNLIFYLRFLESLTHTYWLEQMLAPDRQLEHTRHELARKDRRIRQLEMEVAEKRRQLRAAAQALAQIETAPAVPAS